LFFIKVRGPTPHPHPHLKNYVRAAESRSHTGYNFVDHVEVKNDFNMKVALAQKPKFISISK